MQLDDLIIVSVDDHVVEPPDLFERHLPAKYTDIAPQLIHKDDGTDVWQFQGFEVPNIGLNAVAGRPKEEYGIDPTSFEEIRAGCFDVEKRVLDMNANGVLGSLNFPSLPGFAGRLFGALDDKDTSVVLDPGVQRLAHRRVVRVRPRALHPARDPDDLGPGGDSRPRSGGSRRRAATRSRSRRTPSRSASRACTRTTGTRSGRRAPTSGRSSACTSARPASS